MKKIAIIFDGSLTDRKGLVNAVLYRAKYLKATAQNFQIDVYNFHASENFLVRKLRHTNKEQKYSVLNVEGFQVKVFWYSSTLLDYILNVKFKKRPLLSRIAYLSKVPVFKKYDLISAHSTSGGFIAYAINKKYGIPYYVTWHGSDIHTAPFQKKYLQKETIAILENAKCNFFVSKALLEISNKLSVNSVKTILYNGVGPSFSKYEEYVRNKLRDKFLVKEKKVVCFAGNVIDVKNPLLLPKIFGEVKEKYNGDVVFWVIGDGKLRPIIEKEFSKLELDYKCWGNVPANLMVDYLNCVNVLVLPSKNEGLPLITIEALRCGANVVGSNVGGIKEAIGINNVFDLNEDFIKNISRRIVQMLSASIEQSLDCIFSWESTAKKEYNIYKKDFFD